MEDEKASSHSAAPSATTDLALSQATLKNLNDKEYPRRKLGALDVENVTRAAITKGDKATIDSLLAYLGGNMAMNTNSSSRKGGMIAVAAVGIGLGAENIEGFLPAMIPPVIKCFSDQDSKVRYYACESLYNVAKVARKLILVYFNEIFDGLCIVTADPDANVKNGAQLLDRLVKDIVTESDTFDIKRFIPLLKERIQTTNTFVRHFIVNWIVVLDSVPDIELLDYLPEFIDGMFVMLADANKDIRRRVDMALGEFLKEIKEGKVVAYSEIVMILITHCASQEEFTKLTAITWCQTFIELGGTKLLHLSAQLLGAILPALAHNKDDIRDAAMQCNNVIMNLVKDAEEIGTEVIPSIIFITTQQLCKEWIPTWIPTRVAALRWILMIYRKVPDKVHASMDELFPVLLKTLSDPSEEIARLDLEVMSRICQNDEFFNHFVKKVLELFSTDRKLLNDRGSLVIRHMSMFLNPERIFRAIASIMEEEDDMEFVALMVQTLSLILFTASEFFDLRTTLQDLSSAQSQQLFEHLYSCWCYSPVATLSLCLLVQAYEHACNLVFAMARMDVDVGMLMELDKLVQLLESPVFTRLRLQLLEPEKHPFLFKVLYAILMLLPQGTAWLTLKNRLSSIDVSLLPKSKPNITTTSSPPPATAAAAAAAPGLDFDKLMTVFLKKTAKKPQKK